MTFLCTLVTLTVLQWDNINNRKKQIYENMITHMYSKDLNPRTAVFDSASFLPWLRSVLDEKHTFIILPLRSPSPSLLQNCYFLDNFPFLLHLF